ncbi:hypothetical protein BJY00DRAFT_284752 [Aspergillus carlsbadensis]|nr:hypothetical protein BJY00DRAFT_284752 [Aspergillus carlsbadensis]
MLPRPQGWPQQMTVWPSQKPCELYSAVLAFKPAHRSRAGSCIGKLGIQMKARIDDSICSSVDPALPTSRSVPSTLVNRNGGLS